MKTIEAKCLESSEDLEKLKKGDVVYLASHFDRFAFAGIFFKISSSPKDEKVYTFLKERDYDRHLGLTVNTREVTRRSIDYCDKGITWLNNRVGFGLIKQANRDYAEAVRLLENMGDKK